MTVAQDTSDTRGPHKVCNPTPYSKQSQLWNKNHVALVGSWKPPRTETAHLSGQPAQLSWWVFLTITLKILFLVVPHPLAMHLRVAPRSLLLLWSSVQLATQLANQLSPKAFPIELLSNQAGLSLCPARGLLHPRGRGRKVVSWGWKSESTPPACQRLVELYIPCAYKWSSKYDVCTLYTLPPSYLW